MSTATTPPARRFLIWGGATGWVGGHLEKLLISQGKDVHTTGVRMENQIEVQRVLDEVRPTHVINCAGKTGRPNVDWCEDHKLETIRANVIGTLIVADECEKRGVHCTVMATGCIYASQYTADHTHLTSPPFQETDPANFSASFYSYTKSRVEDILKTYPATLILRLRMPVSDDLHPRNFVTKITQYARVVNIPNSNSILHDLLPLAIAMAEHAETGVVNFTNPGAISHNEVLALYREIVDPGYTWENFTLEEQSRVIKAGRSNCELDAAKLMGIVKRYQAEGWEGEVPEIHVAYRRCFERMREGLQSRGGALA
ncbi:NAD(P)-binding protein [Hortaea werneckii]|nr:NAD(P)-binding protein [Hortaea werneckii]KAI7502594.1 NAD(P)-binding protein [Hortaea werneckii]